MKKYDYALFIRQHGFRLTPQRRLIMDALLEEGGHSTLEKIYQVVCSRVPSLARTTVSRNLNFLCEMRLVVAADIGGGRKVYEIAGETPHHHLVCRTCGQVVQITHAEVKDFFERMDAQHGYLIDMDHLALFGLCPSCREAIQA
jgi:Fur family transcriptional regulator, ferric uptake regulator